MNIQEFIFLIDNQSTPYRDYRIKYASIVIDRKKLFKPLLEIVFDQTNEASIKASWILDFVIRENPEWLDPYLDYFTKNISNLQQGSSIRAIAKICENVALKNSKNKDSKNTYITQNQIDRIIETCFDWLISDHKVAVKAYAMQTLYELGKKSDWVHDALQKILSQEISNHSAAYKARGKKILKLISKNSKTTPKQ